MHESKSVIFFATLAVLFFGSIAGGQTGGDFTITQSVIAGGGAQQTAGGSFSLDGTIGQSLAGNALSNSPFAVTSGFWNYSPLAPTAASVIVSGRVTTTDGNGIRNVRILLIGASGMLETSLTNSFGYFRFENVAVGETYIFSVSSKRFVFNQPIQVRAIFEDVTDINFIADASIE